MSGDRAVKVPKNVYDLGKQVQMGFRKQGYRRPLWECVVIAKQQHAPRRDERREKNEDVFGWMRL